MAKRKQPDSTAEQPASPAKQPFSVEPDLRVEFDDDFLDDTDATVVNVHSLVLMLASPVFKQMLTTDMNERQRREIKLPGKDPDEFRDFVDSLQLCTAKPLTHESALRLSTWADEYQVDALKEKCEDYLMKFMITSSSFARDYEHAVRHNLTRWAQKCLAAAKEELPRFLAKDANCGILLGDDLTVQKIWPTVCEKTGLAFFSSTWSAPPAEHVRSMWPILRKALKVPGRDDGPRFRLFLD
jgi:hypothetical protein